MEILWAPWRMEYVSKESKKGCFLCEALKKEDGEENLILFRGNFAFVIMNRFPYNNGHLMIAPLKHKGELEELDEEELKEIFSLSQYAVKILKKIYQPQGFNLGINLGKCAGAGLIEHLHLHILPRWEGDTNFMPTLSKTKVIPESLSSVYEKLSPFFKKLKEL